MRFLMKKYRIAGITLEISDFDNAYLKHNIDNYIISDKEPCRHQIHVSFHNDIEKPLEEPINQKNPFVVILEKDRIIYIEGKDKRIKMVIKHDKTFKHVYMRFNQNAITDLDEFVYTWLGLIFMDIALTYGLLPIHGASINDANTSIIISAPSQTGKSTHAKLWLELDPTVSIQNDDKPLIGKKDQKIIVFSSPFSGKTSHNQNIEIPLKALIFLEQSPIDSIEPMSKDDIIKDMMKNIMRPGDSLTWENILSLIHEIIENIPIYRLKATPHITAAILLRNTLSKRK